MLTMYQPLLLLMGGASGGSASTAATGTVFWNSESHLPDTTVLVLGGHLNHAAAVGGAPTVTVCYSEPPPHPRNASAAGSLAGDCTGAEVVGVSDATVQFVVPPPTDLESSSAVSQPPHPTGITARLLECWCARLP
jgi:hypothetical protein